MNGLDDIPTTSAPPERARPSAVVAALRGYRPSRRTVLRALVLGVAATTLVPLDWYLSKRQAAAEPADRSEYGVVPAAATAGPAPVRPVLLTIRSTSRTRADSG